MERQGDCQCEEEVVVLDRSHVDRLPGQLGVLVVEFVEVTDWDPISTSITDVK